MSTQLATQQYRLEQWAGIIRARSESGMRIRDFCAQHDLSENAYYYWLRKVRAAAIDAASPQFVELAEPATATDGTSDDPGVVIELNGARILVGNNTSHATLSMVMEVVKHA